MHFTYTFHGWHLVPLVFCCLGMWLLTRKAQGGPFDLTGLFLGTIGLLCILIGLAFVVGRCSV